MKTGGKVKLIKINLKVKALLEYVLFKMITS